MDPFLAHLTAQGLAPSTIRAYAQDLYRFIDWFMDTNGEPLSAEILTPSDIRDYRSSLKKLSPATINRRLAAIKIWASWKGVNLGRIRSAAEQKRAPRWLERAEAHKLIREIERAQAAARTGPAAAAADRDIAIVITLLNTGLRIAELAALEIGDLEIGDRSGRVVVRAGKGGKRREIPLNAQTRESLRIWLRRRADLGRRISGREWREPAAALWIGQRGPLAPRAIERIVARYARRAGLGEISPHRLRHTFAKSLVDTGTSLDQIAELMGHTRIETTRIYTRPGAQDLARAVDRLDT